MCEVEELYEVGMNSRKGYVIYPRLFNVVFNKIVRQANKRATGRRVKM